MVVTIVGVNNNSGLEYDNLIIKSVLSENGFEVEYVDLNKKFTPLNKESAISIFLEVYDFRYFSAKNILIPNQEWFPLNKINELNFFNSIFCKTHYAFDIFKKYHNNVRYIGFSSRDLFDEYIEKKYICFHSSGKSKAKGTSFVMEAWEKNSDLPQLNLISNFFIPTDFTQSPIIHNFFLDNENYRKIANECLIHIFPSQVEGFGHVLNEARSCASVLITIDYPPMNELSKKNLIAPTSIYKIPDRLGEVAFIEANSIAKLIKKIILRNDLVEIGKKNRQLFLKNDLDFKKRLLLNLSTLRSLT